ncbi:protein FLC EXPRESSOR isoform X2 [Rosa rugosa]|uniref:protein FLC EXPRESSOR isoform X2 n=1 Tax=Rosa rugosa TaxID=74645 RepID=UPI002B40C564|nr:protein FLC EXPRESSOR isoform X2 [Rosa rugosa]
MAGREPRHLHRLPQIVNTTALEDRVDLQQREIQSLLGDNQRLAATHVALKQDLTAAQSDLRNLKAVAGQIKSERNAEVREVYDRSLKLDDELRDLDAMNAELTLVRNDIEDLSTSRMELATELKTIQGEIERARSDESKQIEAIRDEIETLKLEIEKGRTAVEIEKKTRASNLEHRQAMENYMAKLALEIEKLHGELANAEKRARAAVAAANPGSGYPMAYGNAEMLYGGNAYPDPYAMHQGQGSADGTPQYGSAQMPHNSYDIQQTHVHR